MIATTKLETSLERVKKFKVMDIKTGIRNKFYLSDYKVPIVDGISKFEYNKGIDKVKPSTLEYIIFSLHNVDEDMVLSAIEVLLYYWRIKKRDPRTMKAVYDKIYRHYTVLNGNYVSLVDIEHKAVVYSISFFIGSVRYNKFGYTTDRNRFIKIVSDIKSKYPLVSIGNFTVNQIIQFKTEEEAISFENEALSNLKKHKNYSKCKNCFNGYKEAYLHI